MNQSGFHVEHAPIGPVFVDVVTGVAQPVPLHWYHCESDAACTHVRAGTARPSVAESQNA